jgi:hypothetical protein
MTQPRRHPALALAAAALLGCPSGPAVGPSVPGGGVGEVGETFSSITANLLVPRCATSACHTGSPPDAAPVSLDAERAWVELVGVPSVQVPGLAVVEPGDPQASYLVHKLRGTAASVGGFGNPMPPSDEPLTEAQILAIEAWIASGAPND